MKNINIRLKMCQKHEHIIPEESFPYFSVCSVYLHLKNHFYLFFFFEIVKNLKFTLSLFHNEILHQIQVSTLDPKKLIILTNLKACCSSYNNFLVKTAAKKDYNFVFSLNKFLIVNI